MLRGLYFQAIIGFFGASAGDAEALAMPEYNPRCILAEIEWVDDAQVLHTQYLSNFGFTTGETDTPPNKCYVDLIGQAPTVSARIDNTMQIGRLTIRTPMLEAEPSGIALLFDWYQRAWRGHNVRLFIGAPTSPRADFSIFFSGTVESVSMDGDGTVAFALSDKGLLLQEAVTKDYGFYGKVFNFEPVYVGNGLSDTYQLDSIGRTENTYFYPSYFSSIGGLFVTCNGIGQILEVRDNGSPVSFTESKSKTQIELAIPPAGTITVDAIKSPDYSAGAVIRAIAADAGISGDSIDNALVGQAKLGVGYVIAQNQTINYMEILQEIAKSAGGYLQWSWSGKLEFYFIDLTKSPIMDIGLDDMTSEGCQLLSVDDPISFLQVGYKRNWKVQDYSGLAGIAQIDASPFTAEYQYVKHDYGKTYQYPIAMQVSIDTLISDPADAQIEFARRLNQRRFKMVSWSLKSFNILTSLKLGSIIAISYPKLGITNLACCVIGADFDPNVNLTELSLWSYLPGLPIPGSGFFDNVVYPETIDFVGVPLSGNAPLSVQFTDLSDLRLQITRWEWDFDDKGTYDGLERNTGSPSSIDSILQNPIHVYLSPGVYSVSMTVWNDYGSNYRETKLNYITVTTPLPPSCASNNPNMIDVPVSGKTILLWEKDNVSHLYHCPPLPIIYYDDNEGPYTGLRTTAGTVPFQNQKRTITIVYHTSGNPNFYWNALVGSTYWPVPFVNSVNSTMVHFNVASNHNLVFTFTSWAGLLIGWGGPGPWSNQYDGEIWIECIKIEVRDYTAKGEALRVVYNGAAS